MEERGLEYGPAFRSLVEGWRGDFEALGALRSQGIQDGHGHATRITLLDGALQMAVASLPETARGAFVPVNVESLHVYSSLTCSQPIWAHAALSSEARDDSSFVADVRVIDNDGRVLAEVLGMRLQSIEPPASTALDGWLHEVAWHLQARPEAVGDADGTWLVIATQETGRAIAASLKAHGGRCSIVNPGGSIFRHDEDDVELDSAASKDLASVLAASFPIEAPPRGVIYAWPLDTTRAEANPMVAENWAWGAIETVQALFNAGWPAAPRLWMATRCAQPAGDVGVDATGAVVWGIGRVAANEHPELRCSLVDLGQDDGIPELCAEILATSEETQVALRGENRYVARLEPRSVDVMQGGDEGRPERTDEPYRIEATRPGILDSIGARPAARRSPAAGEVEIRVQAAGINFIDVMKAMGICPGFEPRPDSALGGECAGVVVAVGPEVSGIAPGDSVVAFTPSFRDVSCLGAYVTVPAELVAPRPSNFSPVDSAGQMIAFMTAHYALHELGRLRRGDRVLIHAATGGVGLAAIELARRAGAQVFATAGSPEKRSYLSDLGVEHVYDSRTLAFADEVLADTGGRGVDVVLNSLSGDAIAASLHALAPRGRFVEIGKRDIYENTQLGLSPFRKNLSYFALDIARMVEEDRGEVAELFQKVVRLLDDHEVNPLPVSVFRASAAAEAFRTMAQARHIGKLVVKIDDEPVDIVTSGSLVIRPDASYL
ncbi:MAG TPA: polyketide synthase dehydratase domain-containing protein, partial [Thermomicrobiales bacterium]|nr:polyketide synthase dehydratase domain-containing protein [Thermomicrobiales bacterium]